MVGLSGWGIGPSQFPDLHRTI